MNPNALSDVPERLALYVPEPATADGRALVFEIRQGSAIVGTPGEYGILIDYEGNLYGTDPKDYEEKLQHAAGRHRTRYPTVARAFAPPGSMRQVGHAAYNEEWRRWVVECIEDEAALAGWLGDEGLPRIGGDESRRGWTPRQIQDLMHAARRDPSLLARISDKARQGRSRPE